MTSGVPRRLPQLGAEGCGPRMQLLLVGSIGFQSLGSHLGRRFWLRLPKRREKSSQIVQNRFPPLKQQFARGFHAAADVAPGELFSTSSSSQLETSNQLDAPDRSLRLEVCVLVKRWTRGKHFLNTVLGESDKFAK